MVLDFSKRGFCLEWTLFCMLHCRCYKHCDRNWLNSGGLRVFFFFFFGGGVLCIIKWWKKQTQRTQIYTLFDSLLDPASVRQQCPSWFIWCADLFLNNWHAIPLFLHRNVENNLFSGPIPEKLLDIPNFRWRTNYLLVYFTPKFIRYTCAFMEKRMYKTYG
jgi:hypothetical protein